MRSELKKMAFLGGATALVLLLVFLEAGKLKKEVEVKEESKKVFSLESNEILSIQTKQKNFNKQSPGVWKQESPSRFLNYSELDQWASKLLSLEGKKLSDPGEELNWAKFSLAEGQEAAELVFKSKKKEQKVLLSPRESFDGGVYLKVITTSQRNPSPIELLYTSESSEWRSLLTRPSQDFLSKKILDWKVYRPEAEIRSFVLRSSNSLHFNRTEDGAWKLKEQPKWNLSSQKVEDFLTRIQKQEYARELSEKPEGLKRIGSLNLKDQEQREYILEVFKDKKQLFANNNQASKLFFRLSSSEEEFYFPKALDFKSFSDVLDFKSEETVQIQSSRSKTTKRDYRKRKGEWKRYQKGKEPSDINGGAVEKFFALIKELPVKRFVVPKKFKKQEDVYIKLYKRGRLLWSLYPGQRVKCLAKDKYESCTLVKIYSYYLALPRKELRQLLRFNFNKSYGAEEASKK